MANGSILPPSESAARLSYSGPQVKSCDTARRSLNIFPYVINCFLAKYLVQLLSVRFSKREAHIEEACLRFGTPLNQFFGSDKIYTRKYVRQTHCQDT